MNPMRQFKVDFNPQPNKKQEKEKVKTDFKKKPRPITGKVAAFVEDSKSKLEKMMKIKPADKEQKQDELEEPEKPKIKPQTLKQPVEQKQQPKAQFNTQVFLKTQKQKQKQYAKQLQKQFQESKKQRMDKLYKRQKDANQKISQTKVEIKTKHKLYDQLPTLIRYPVQTSNEFILDTHQTTKIKQFISFINVKQLRENEEQMFDSKYKWQKAQKLCDDITKLKFIDIRNEQVNIKNSIMPYPGHDNLFNILSLIAMKPQLLQKITLWKQKMVTEKVYPFLFYKNNKRFTVLVDNYLQIQQLEFEQVQAFSHSKDANTLWISLFEKAYLKLFKEVGTIHEVCNNILNVMPEIVKISDNAVIKQNIFDALRFYLRNGGLIGAMRKGELKGSSAYEGRVYPIKQVRVGKTLEQSSFLVVNPWHGKSLLSDGRQYISLKDLTSKFNRLILIKDYPASYSGIQLNINMYSFGILASNNPEWVKNHQYLINVNKTSTFRMVLKRCNQYPQIFGFMLLKCQPQDTKVVAINLDRLVTTVRSTLVNEASFTGQLEKGSYMLIPFTHKKSEDTYVFLKLQLFTSNPDNYTWGKSKIVEVEYREIGMVDQKVEADLEVTQKFQKPRAKLILQKGDKHLLPDLLLIKDLPNLAVQNALHKSEDLLVPGLAHRLLVRQNVVIEQKPVSEKQKEKVSVANPETSYQTQNQQLKILLGIDAYTDEVDKQMMTEALDHLEQEIDFNHYQLGDEGFQRIVEFIMEQPRITILNLRNNLLSDKSIVLLCYYLEKGNHTELKRLNLADNQIKTMGFNALQGLAKRIQNLKQITLTGNPGLKVEQIKSLSKL